MPPPGPPAAAAAAAGPVTVASLVSVATLASAGQETCRQHGIRFTAKTILYLGLTKALPP